MDIATQAYSLVETAQKMVDAGQAQYQVGASTLSVLEVLVETAKREISDNPMVQAITVNEKIRWGDVLAIANVIYKS